jgi:hypothetical protein
VVAGTAVPEVRRSKADITKWRATVTDVAAFAVIGRASPAPGPKAGNEEDRECVRSAARRNPIVGPVIGAEDLARVQRVAVSAVLLGLGATAPVADHPRLALTILVAAPNPCIAVAHLGSKMEVRETDLLGRGVASPNVVPSR